MPSIWFHTLSVKFRLANIYITLTCMSNIHHDTETHHLNVFYLHRACYISIPQRLLFSPFQQQCLIAAVATACFHFVRYDKMGLERLVNMYVYAQMEENVNVTQNIHTMCCVILTTITIRVDITTHMNRYLLMLIYMKTWRPLCF